MRKLSSIAIAIFFFISACTKIESTTIGSGLIPPVDGVTTLDTTLDVFTNNYLDPLGDSAKVYKTDDHVIGIINTDPLFGTTKASAFFELKPTTYPFSFPNASTLTADSAVLILSYKGVFGDTTIPQNWEVRELTESLRGDTVFNVSKSVATGNILGTKTINIPRLKDSVNYGFENANNQIRIKLSQTLASRLIRQFDSTANTGAYSKDTVFRENFKGFAVMPAAGSGGNALIRVNLSDTNTKLALFYTFQNTSAAKKDTAVSYFRFSDGTAIPVSGNANYIKRDRTGSQSALFTTGPTTRNDSLVFIQTMPGTFATIKIPRLREFPNVLVHRAELLAFQAPDATSLALVLTPPRYLLLSSYDSTKKVQINIPNDFSVLSGTPNISTFGGFIMEREVPGYGIVKAYNFDISRYVQGIVSRKDSSLTLRLSAPSNDSLQYTPPYPQPNAVSTFYITPSVANNLAEGRVRLGGGGMTRQNQLRMRVRIVYSRI
ncbi:DUF4270 family protein [Segetibacter aerophilus]|uniref:DUF4270 domain-containing protein n=1 Tax=Segetibacter aerophilus TaxID=670293 RepID=A0A512B7Z5_9BACT|nr:DUF4270 family protein [Segetibacter aerophilus]GEO08078.1 hypothetical protein SAE01_05740 [Segetibacter aerophilus]